MEELYLFTFICGVMCVMIFVVKDDDESEMSQASCQTDPSISSDNASLPPSDIFAANSGRMVILSLHC